MSEEQKALTAADVQSIVDKAMGGNMEDLKKSLATLADSHKAVLESNAKAQKEREDNEFQSAFPGIPADLVPTGLSHADRMTFAKKLVAYKGSTPETTQKKEGDWQKAGHVSPTLDPAKAAAKADEEKKRRELVASGNAKGVLDHIFGQNAERIRGIFHLPPTQPQA